MQCQDCDSIDFKIISMPSPTKLLNDDGEAIILCEDCMATYSVQLEASDIVQETEQTEWL